MSILRRIRRGIQNEQKKAQGMRKYRAYVIDEEKQGRQPKPKRGRQPKPKRVWLSNGHRA